MKAGLYSSGLGYPDAAEDFLLVLTETDLACYPFAVRERMSFFEGSQNEDRMYTNFYRRVCLFYLWGFLSDVSDVRI